MIGKPFEGSTTPESTPWAHSTAMRLPPQVWRTDCKWKNITVLLFHELGSLRSTRTHSVCRKRKIARPVGVCECTLSKASTAHDTLQHIRGLLSPLSTRSHKPGHTRLPWRGPMFPTRTFLQLRRRSVRSPTRCSTLGRVTGRSTWYGSR